MGTIICKELGQNCQREIKFETSYIPICDEVKTEEGFVIGHIIREPIIHLTVSDYKEEYHFGKTPNGKNKRKSDWNEFMKCIFQNGVPCSINFIPYKNGNAMIQIKEIKAMEYAND